MRISSGDGGSHQLIGGDGASFDVSYVGDPAKTLEASRRLVGRNWETNRFIKPDLFIDVGVFCSLTVRLWKTNE